MSVSSAWTERGQQRRSMQNFPHQLVVSHDPSIEPVPKIAFVYNDVAITDPCTSSCGRFLVEPFEYDLSYDQVEQLKRINDAVDAATDLAIQKGQQALDQALELVKDVKSSDFFGGPSPERQAIWSGLAAYVVTRFNAVHRKQSETTTQKIQENANSVPRIGQEGIELVRADREPLRGLNTWWNSLPLPMGHVCVFCEEEQGLAAPLWVESSRLNIRVFDLAGQCLATYAVDGRPGLNQAYEALVGYKPDEDSFEPDAVKLLARFCEMAYRHATGDDA